MNALERVTEPHRTLLSLMQQTHHDFYTVEHVWAGEAIFKRAVQGLREIRRYFYKEDIDSMAAGKAASIVRGQDSLAKLFHLIQDAAAHCQVYNGEVCVEQATYSALGLGNAHQDINDKLLGPDGKKRFNTLLAEKQTELMAQLLTTSDTTQFNAQLQHFLDTFYTSHKGDIGA